MKKNGLFTSYFTSTLSISLVIFLLGCIILLLVGTQKSTKYIQENFEVTLVLKSHLKSSDISMLDKVLKTKPFIRSTKYISKEEGIENLQSRFKIDVNEVLDENPLPEIIDVKLSEDFLSLEKFDETITYLDNLPQTESVMYPQTIFKEVTHKIQMVGLLILIISVIMIFISIILINNTVKLSIYSKRFIINTMQLIGATSSFIRRPFVTIAVIQGIYSAIIATALMGFVLYTLFTNWLKVYITQEIIIEFGIWVVVLTLVSIALTTFSTFIAVNKHLNTKSDKLF